MVEVTDIKSLKAGDKIVNISGAEVSIAEIVCRHPHDAATIVLDSCDLKSISDYAFSRTKWYYYTDASWIEIYNIIIDNVKKNSERDIKFYEERKMVIAKRHREHIKSMLDECKKKYGLDGVEITDEDVDNVIKIIGVMNEADAIEDVVKGIKDTLNY